MIYYSQKDPRWANQKIGTCQKDFKGNGCFVTCLAMFANKTPLEVNKLLMDNGGYSQGCLVNSERSSQILELAYNGKTWERPSATCIAETVHFASQGVPQHFIILLDTGKIIDPLDAIPTPKGNPYRITSYRLFKIKNTNPMPTTPTNPLISRGEFDNLAWRYHGPKLLQTDIDWWWQRFLKGEKTLDGILTEWDRSETAKNWKKEILQAFDDQSKYKNQEKEVTKLVADLNICRLILHNIHNEAVDY